MPARLLLITSHDTNSSQLAAMLSDMSYACSSSSEVFVSVSVNRFFVNVEVAIARDGQYLMIVRGDKEEYGAGWLGMPGGTVESEYPTPDALEITARREVMEEVGLDLDDMIFYVESHTFGDEAPCLDVVMLARAAAATDEPVIASPGEVAELRWMSLNDILADPRTQLWTRESLQRAEQLRTCLNW